MPTRSDHKVLFVIDVPLEEELALVKSYIAIMEERFGDDLHFGVSIPASTQVAIRTLKDAVEPDAGRRVLAISEAIANA
jgi:hypothetical protein